MNEWREHIVSVEAPIAEETDQAASALRDDNVDEVQALKAEIDDLKVQRVDEGKATQDLVFQWEDSYAQSRIRLQSIAG